MGKILSIYYHNPTPEQLERLLKRYTSKGYRFISAEELFTILSEKRTVKEKIGFISLDDGWQSNLQLIPVIEKYNAHLCIFVATEPLISGNYWWEFITKERGRDGMIKFKSLPYNEFYRQLADAKKTIHLERSSMTVDELKTISNHPLVSIQSHTVNHPILTSVPDDMLEKELIDSKRELEDLCKKDIFAFSYPNGSLFEREVASVSKVYSLAFTIEQRHISEKENLYLLPRVALTGEYYKDLLKIYGFWPVIKKVANIFKGGNK